MKYLPVTSRLPIGSVGWRSPPPRALRSVMFWVTTSTSGEPSRRKHTISFARGATAVVALAAQAYCRDSGTPGWALE